MPAARRQALLGTEFAGYVRWNILATQRLLETLREMPVRKIVYSPGPSMYGVAALKTR